MVETLEDIRRVLQAHRQTLRERYGIELIGLFGSWVRGEERPESDIDVLVAFTRPVSLLELVAAELFLSDLLGKRVDLVPRGNLRPELSAQILNKTVPL
ncbi:nucleotidyltransferase family protein [Rhodothermus marinus]|uniref:nucleotidyltransferase family protein n=1 Tax=Rhodothermus marinus TaxID=29549 RepID=UPI0006D1DC17|nr:nucleotidyltransferase family protein [Rhodothermus marinus]